MVKYLRLKLNGRLSQATYYLGYHRRLSSSLCQFYLQLICSGYPFRANDHRPLF